jgi:RNAse (barnase) inhibitor barstar
MPSVSDWVWLRHEFPWLGHGFIHAIDDDIVDWFGRELERLGFAVCVLDSDVMTDEASFWREVRVTFDFPDYQGSNWDAFDDSFGDLELPERLARMATERRVRGLESQAVRRGHGDFQRSTSTSPRVPSCDRPHRSRSSLRQA